MRNYPLHATELSNTDYLARWSVVNSYWIAFIKAERMYLLNACFNSSVVIFLAGTVLLTLVGEWSISVAMTVSSTLALLLGWMKYNFSKMAMGQITKGHNHDVIITRDSVVMNGKVNIFKSIHYEPRNISLLKLKTVHILQISYRLNGRRSFRFDTLRVPVPIRHLNEARALISKISLKISIEKKRHSISPQVFLTKQPPLYL